MEDYKNNNMTSTKGNNKAYMLQRLVYKLITEGLYYQTNN